MAEPSAPAGDVTSQPAPDADPGETGIEALVVAGGGRTWWLAGAGVVAVAAAVALTGWFVVRDERAQDAAGGDAGVRVRDVVVYDPAGGEGVDNPSRPGLAVDGDELTAWRTLPYGTPDFGGEKLGVGLILDLGSPTTVGAVEVVTKDAGWSADVFVSDVTHAAILDWGSPAARGTGLPTEVRFEVGPATGRFVMVWFTWLPPRGELTVSEVRVVRAPG